jgi:hypothetical protein
MKLTAISIDFVREERNILAITKVGHVSSSQRDVSDEYYRGNLQK